MKAIVQKKYGDVDKVVINEIPIPEPKENQVLVKMKATSVNFNTLGFITGKPFIIKMFTGLFKPNIQTPGNDFAGIVDSVGKNVTKVQPGDEVFGDTKTFGTLAEYVAVSENELTKKPEGLSFEDAAALPEAALVAYQGLKDSGEIQAGQKVLIAGASGGIGTFAVQFAKHFGTEVTAICSTRNIELIKSLGADKIIDYTKEDFLDANTKYDVILSSAGYRPIKDYKKALTPNGKYVSAGGKMKQFFQAMLLGPFHSKKGGKKLSAFSVVPNKDLEVVRDLVTAGKIKPVIDKVYPFEKAIDALNHYNSRKTRGKIIIRF